jgi:hypothetical protein
MWSIIGLVGLAISFSGATLMASKGVKSEDEILSEAAPRLPVGGPPGSNQYKKSLREMPNVQALLRQSKLARFGLWILAIGFIFQFGGALGSFIVTK